MSDTFQNELIMLFGYETGGGRGSLLWREPFYFHNVGGQSAKQLDERYSNWMSNNKRPIQKEEMLDGIWKKIGDHGYTFIVRFLPDGTFIEHNVASEKAVAHGTWTQIWPVISTSLEQMERGETVQYVLTMIANKTGLIHSAIETRNWIPNAYFKMIHLI